MRNISYLLLACSFAVSGVVHGQQHVTINDGPDAVQRDGAVLSIDATGAITAAWNDYRDGSQQIYVSRSTDGGLTWSKNNRASSTAAVPTGGPVLSTDANNNVTVGWGDLRHPPMWSRVDICVTHSSDGGATFSADPRINDDSFVNQQQPDITAIGNDVFMVWHGFPSSDQPQPATPLWVARSTDAGKTFGAQTRIDAYGKVATDTIGTCNCCPQNIFSNGATNVYSPFRIDSANMRDIFLARSTDKGVTWLPAVRVSHGRWFLDACPGTGPSGAARGDTVWISYMDQRNNTRQTVYCSRSTDGGATFGPDVRVGDIGGYANYPSLVVDSRGRVFCCWSGVPRNNRANVSVAVSEDGGLTFGPSVWINTDTTIVNSQIRCVLGANDSVYCTWQEQQSTSRNRIVFTNVTEKLYSQPALVRGGDETRPTLFSVSPQPVIAGRPSTLQFAPGVTSLVSFDELGRQNLATSSIETPLPSCLSITWPHSGTFFLIAKRGLETDFAKVVVLK